MAEENENGIEQVKAADNEINVSQLEETTQEPVVKVDSYKDDHHINLTWRSWMVVLYVYFGL
jgi:hypothetical protein